MQNNFSYFLMVAEELNISKAAKRLFVSQQCLSSHIKKLETEYNTLLLVRKPKLALTPAGESMVRMLKQMQLLEANLKSELVSTEGEEKGYIKIGLHSSRSEQFGTTVFSRYWDKFPHVVISVTDGTSSSFEYMLSNGQLDMYVGVNPLLNKKHEQLLLFGEQLFIAMTDNTIRRYFPGKYPDCLSEFSQGIDLRNLCEVPLFFCHDEQSMITHALASYLAQNDIQLNIRAYSNNGLMRNSLAAMDYGASICTELRRNTVQNLASTRKPLPSPLHFFPIKDFSYINNLYLVFRKNIYQPMYFRGFVNNMIECFSNFSK